MSHADLVSCVMITRSSRLARGERAIGDFFVQTWPERELLVLHDGDDAAHEAWSALATKTPGPPVRVLQAPPGLSLGQLRNVATDAAQGTYLCQWDDDDRYHPERIALQMAALREQGADFCFLRDQLHWFARDGELHWDDWNQDAYPLNFVQGTLLGRKQAMPRYPDAARGEDTAVTVAILTSGHRVARLADAGWCYVYIHHGDNVWDAEHHQAISKHKRRSPAKMQNLAATMKRRLGEYVPPLVPVKR